MRNRYLALLFLVLSTHAAAQQTGDSSRPIGSLLQRAVDGSPAATSIIVDSAGSPAHVAGDWDGDGNGDVALLSVVSSVTDSPSLQALSDRARLYDASVPPVLIAVEVTLSQNTTPRVVSLGARRVISDFQPIALSNTATGVQVTFRSAVGTEYEIITVDRAGSPHRTSYAHTSNEFGYLSDLDDDGSTELIRSITSPEAGRGFETFLTRLTLQNGQFAMDGSVAIVRSVREFLDLAAITLKASDWDRFVDLVAPHSSGASSLEGAFLPLAPESDGVFDYRALGTAIDDVVFPIVRDNPLPIPFLGRSFPILMRVDCCDRSPRYFQARIRFPENPFDGGALTFLTEEESEQ